MVDAGDQMPTICKSLFDRRNGNIVCNIKVQGIIIAFVLADMNVRLSVESAVCLQ